MPVAGRKRQNGTWSNSDKLQSSDCDEYLEKGFSLGKVEEIIFIKPPGTNRPFPIPCDHLSMYNSTRTQIAFRLEETFNFNGSWQQYRDGSVTPPPKASGSEINNHPVEDEHIERPGIVNDMKARIRRDPTLSLHAVYEEVVSELPDDAEVPPFASVKSSLYRCRAAQMPAIPANIDLTSSLKVYGHKQEMAVASFECWTETGGLLCLLPNTASGN
ncbi:hypothetical protein ACOMHN_019295 [Nucella lapillus]